MFLGTHTPKLDEKGRLILPAKFRDELAEGLVITIYQEQCLVIWTPSDFRQEMTRLESSEETERGGRNLKRMFASSASEQQPDKQGRISVPALLRDYAGLDKDCVVVGALDRVEVWNPERWARFYGEQLDRFAAMDGRRTPAAT